MTEGNGSTASRQSLLWLVYGQIAAMLGAFSLLVFLTHFVDVGLKGIVRDAFEGWVAYVRPIIGYPLQLLIDQLPEAWRFDLPNAVKDYLAVGVVLEVSFERAVALHPDYWKDVRKLRPGQIVTWVSNVLATIVIWPKLVVAALSDLVVGKWPLFHVVWLSPLVYLGLLLAANAWLV